MTVTPSGILPLVALTLRVRRRTGDGVAARFSLERDQRRARRRSCFRARRPRSARVGGAIWGRADARMGVAADGELAASARH